jgi:hypothetical protein
MSTVVLHVYLYLGLIYLVTSVGVLSMGPWLSSFLLEVTFNT